MGKGKLAKFADMAANPLVFEYPYSVIDDVPFDMKGNWNRDFSRMKIRLCWSWDADVENTQWVWHAVMLTRILSV